MSTGSIGRNATRIWKLMNNGAVWSYEQIKHSVNLSDREINAAIGWLAREDTLEIIQDPATLEETYRVRHFWDMAGI